MARGGREAFGLVLIKFPFPQNALGAAESKQFEGEVAALRPVIVLRFVTCRCDLVFFDS